jgi:tRNA A22 N-methylase
LGLSFIDYPEIKQIHLVDPSGDVINVLKNKIIDSYITKQPLISIHKLKGQDVILNTESKIIFIAGMGGKEIGEIITHLLPQLSAEDRLVISPHRNILELRKQLHLTDLKLVDEIVLKEEGQFYQIICLSKSSIGPKVSIYGSKIWDGPSGEEYRQHQIGTFSNHQDIASRDYVTHLKQLSH